LKEVRKEVGQLQINEKELRAGRFGNPNFVPYNVGDQVLFKNRNGPDRFAGPAEIIKEFADGKSYELETEDGDSYIRRCEEIKQFFKRRTSPSKSVSFDPVETVAGDKYASDSEDILETIIRQRIRRRKAAPLNVTSSSGDMSSASHSTVITADVSSGSNAYRDPLIEDLVSTESGHSSSEGRESPISQVVNIMSESFPKDAMEDGESVFELTGVDLDQSMLAPTGYFSRNDIMNQIKSIVYNRTDPLYLFQTRTELRMVVDTYRIPIQSGNMRICDLSDSQLSEFVREYLVEIRPDLKKKRNQGKTWSIVTVEERYSYAVAMPVLIEFENGNFFCLTECSYRRLLYICFVYNIPVPRSAVDQKLLFTHLWDFARTHRQRIDSIYAHGKLYFRQI